MQCRPSHYGAHANVPVGPYIVVSRRGSKTAQELRASALAVPCILPSDPTSSKDAYERSVATCPFFTGPSDGTIFTSTRIIAPHGVAFFPRGRWSASGGTAHLSNTGFYFGLSTDYTASTNVMQSPASRTATGDKVGEGGRGERSGFFVNRGSLKIVAGDGTAGLFQGECVFLEWLEMGGRR